MNTAFVKHRVVIRVSVLYALFVFGNTCGPSEYKSSKGECCPMCNIGSVVYSDCLEDSSTTCIPCSPGTFMNKPNGLYTCFTCSHCSKSQGLYIQSQCTTIKDTVCDVLDGYHCVDVESSSLRCSLARKHSVCPPGQETKTPGTKKSDTVCVDCQSGFYSSAGLTCTRWTDCAAKNEVETEAGSSIKDVKCTKIRYRYGLMVAGLAAVIAIICVIYLCVNNLIKSRLPKHPTEETNSPITHPITLKQIQKENREEEEITDFTSTPGFIQAQTTDSPSCETYINTRRTLKNSTKEAWLSHESHHLAARH